MKIINLVKTEFIKNFSLSKLFISTIIIFFVTSIVLKVSVQDYSSGFDMNTRWMSDDYNELTHKKDKSLEDEYQIVFYKNYLEIVNIFQDSISFHNDWKNSIIHDVVGFKTENFLIDKIIHDKNNDTIKKVCKLKDKKDLSEIEQKINKLCNNYTNDELVDLYKTNDEKYSDYRALIEKDKYYLYLEYELEHGNLESDVFIEAIINNRVEKMDHYLALNYLQYKSVGQDENVSHYQEHKRLKHDNEAFRAILVYSTTHNIPHDIEYNHWNSVNSDDTYMTTKKAVNQVYHLSFIVMIIISITCSGIISNEHSKGTIKNIVTTPVRRSKVLLSKFIYVILNTYLLWFISLIIISIISGIEYGFKDLLTPKLVYTGSKVIEVNYYLYTIKMMFLASIPLVCYVSILFFISVISLNTSLTVGITSVLGILTPVVWILSVVGNIRSIVYTPLWYFDCGFILNNSFHYVEPMLMKDFYYNLSTGIISSIIVIIVLYFITNIVYTKCDIKS